MNYDGEFLTISLGRAFGSSPSMGLGAVLTCSPFQRPSRSTKARALAQPPWISPWFSPKSQGIAGIFGSEPLDIADGVWIPESTGAWRFSEFQELPLAQTCLG